MHWNVVAPFNYGSEVSDSGWLTPYIPNKNHQFTFIPRSGGNVNWHDRQSPVTGYEEWSCLWKQSREAVKTVQGGIITVFPQLSALVGLQRSFGSRRFPTVAWWFNTNFYTGYKRLLAQTALKHIDRFVVHNTCEREAYSQWLGVPIDRFEFVPLQTTLHPLTEPEDAEQPFIVSVGSAQRDYPLLFEAIKKLGIRTVVVSGPRILQGLDIPPTAETPFGLKQPDIVSLTQRARLSVIPLRQEGLVAGTAAIVQALSLGSPLIVTRRQGVGDYVQDGENALLVKPNSLDDMVQTIDRLWNDAVLRDRLRKQSRQYAIQHLSDNAAGAALGRILDQVAAEVGSPTSSSKQHTLQNTARL